MKEWHRGGDRIPEGSRWYTPMPQGRTAQSELIFQKYFALLTQQTKLNFLKTIHTENTMSTNQPWKPNRTRPLNHTTVKKKKGAPNLNIDMEIMEYLQRKKVCWKTPNHLSIVKCFYTLIYKDSYCSSSAYKLYTLTSCIFQLPVIVLKQSKAIPQRNCIR